MTLMHMSLLFLTNSNSMMVKRVLYPGESWVYYKIYCSPRTADKLLSGPIKTLVEQLKEKDLIKKWFFIRYQDPDYHIRLRLEKSEEADMNIVSQLLKHSLSYQLDHQLIHKITVDTYMREIERYGAQTIVQCEEIFHIDSELAITITSLSLSDQQLMAWTLDHLRHYVRCFDLREDQVKPFYKKSRDTFFEEFGVIGKNKAAFRKKNENDKEIIDHFTLSDHTDYRLIQSKRGKITDLIGQILPLGDSNSPSKESLLSSLVHMSVNRLYRDEQRTFEMLCYDYLCR